MLRKYEVQVQVQVLILIMVVIQRVLMSPLSFTLLHFACRHDNNISALLTVRRSDSERPLLLLFARSDTPWHERGALRSGRNAVRACLR